MCRPYNNSGMRKYKYINELVRDRIRIRHRLTHIYGHLDSTLKDIYEELEGRDKLSIRLIKVGAIIFVIPILGISELIGLIVMGIGSFIGIFRRKYPVSRIGRDLSNQIKAIHEFRKELNWEYP